LIVTCQHARRLVLRTPAPRNLSKGRRFISWGQTQLMLIGLGCVFQTHTIQGAWLTLRALAGFAGPAQPVILPSNFHQTWADGIVVILGGTPTSALSVLPGTIEALLLIFFA